MSKILLVNTLEDYPGVNVVALCSLSAVLKSRGHSVVLFDCSMHDYSMNEIEGSFYPDFIGINVMTAHQTKLLKEISSELKKRFSVPIVAGGMSVSTDPDTHINYPSIDAVCLGEGEHVMLDMAVEVNMEKWAAIPNLWVKLKEGADKYRIAKNPVRPLIENLDVLPLMDLSLFSGSLLRHNASYVALMASRGCPYNCTYCANEEYKKIFPNSAEYVRYRSPSLVLKEMSEAKANYPDRAIYFEDDNFALNDQWLNDFSGVLSEANFSHPFSINIRLERINLNIMEKLIPFGLRSVRFGIETGNEDYRQDILRRNVADEAYIRNAGGLRNLGLKLISYNMLGLPFETEEMIKETILLNLKLKVFKGHYQIFKPYKGTPLRELAKNKGLLLQEPEEESDVTKSFISLFVKSNCSQKTYTSYFIALHAYNYILGRFGFLRKFPDFSFIFILFLKNISLLILDNLIGYALKRYRYYYRMAKKSL